MDICFCIILSARCPHIRSIALVDRGLKLDAGMVVMELSTFECQKFAFRVAWLRIIFRGFGKPVLGTCIMNLLLAFGFSLGCPACVTCA
jgi:hypothetical protein